MTLGISLEELLAWSDEAANSWKSFLESTPATLDLSCNIGGAANLQEFVRHIFLAELRWAQRLAGVPETQKEAIPAGPLDAIFEMHREAMQILGGMLSDPAQNWDAPFPLIYSWVPPGFGPVSRRKLFAHALTHSQRHWAQLATLVRTAGFPSGVRGDLLFSSALH